MFEKEQLQIFIMSMLIGCVYFLARIKLDTAYKHRLGQSMQYGVVFSFSSETFAEQAVFKTSE